MGFVLLAKIADEHSRNAFRKDALLPKLLLSCMGVCLIGYFLVGVMIFVLLVLIVIIMQTLVRCTVSADTAELVSVVSRWQLWMELGNCIQSSQCLQLASCDGTCRSNLSICVELDLLMPRG